MFKPLRALKAAMSQQPMEADRDPEHSKSEMPKNRQGQARPCEKPGNEGKQTEQMHQNQHSLLNDAQRLGLFGTRQTSGNDLDSRLAGGGNGTTSGFRTGPFRDDTGFGFVFKLGF